MAELLGTAASVIQVAEAGFSLATTLYTYAKSVKGAEQDIKKIARDVKLTAKVLQRTHEQLQGDRDAQNCTDDAIHDLEEVLEGCKEAFQEVDDALTKSIKTADGKATLSMTEKLKWPLRSNKLAILRANLEKLKTTLLLMLTVLAYGSRVSKSKAASNADSTLEKLQIQNLIEAKDEATQRYEALAKAFAKLGSGTDMNSRSMFMSPGLAAGEAAGILVSSSSTAGSVAPHTDSKVGESDKTSPSIGIAMIEDPTHAEHRSDRTQEPYKIVPEYVVSTRLRQCASAVSRLTSSIDTAAERWASHGLLEHDVIGNGLGEVTKAISMLMSIHIDTFPVEDSPDTHVGSTVCQGRHPAQLGPQELYLHSGPYLRDRNGQHADQKDTYVQTTPVIFDGIPRTFSIPLPQPPASSHYADLEMEQSTAGALAGQERSGRAWEYHPTGDDAPASPTMLAVDRGQVRNTPYRSTDFLQGKSVPVAQPDKNTRRRYEEINGTYKCGWNGCEKAYGTLNHLNAHISLQSHGAKRTKETGPSFDEDRGQKGRGGNAMESAAVEGQDASREEDGSSNDEDSAITHLLRRWVNVGS